MDQDHRHSPWPVGVDHPQAFRGDLLIGGEEPREFGVPDVGSLELIGQGGGRLQLQGYSLPVDLYREGPVNRVELELSENQSGGNALERPRDADEGRPRYLDASGDVLARALGGWSLSFRGDPRRQRGAHSRLSITVAKTAHLELGHGHEPIQSVASPEEILRIGFED